MLMPKRVTNKNVIRIKKKKMSGISKNCSVMRNNYSPLVTKKIEVIMLLAPILSIIII